MPPTAAPSGTASRSPGASLDYFAEHPDQERCPDAHPDQVNLAAALMALVATDRIGPVAAIGQSIKIGINPVLMLEHANRIRQEFRDSPPFRAPVRSQELKAPSTGIPRTGPPDIGETIRLVAGAVERGELHAGEEAERAAAAHRTARAQARAEVSFIGYVTLETAWRLTETLRAYEDALTRQVADEVSALHTGIVGHALAQRRITPSEAMTQLRPLGLTMPAEEFERRALQRWPIAPTMSNSTSRPAPVISRTPVIRAASGRESRGGPRRATAKVGGDRGDDPPHLGDDDPLSGQPSGREAEKQGHDGRPDPRAEFTRSFICCRLVDGRWHFSTDVKRDAAALGIAPRTLRRERVALGVEVRREGFGPGGRWLWRLPADVLVSGPVATERLPGEDELAHAARHRRAVLHERDVARVLAARKRLRRAPAGRKAVA